jgi:predicted transcriptional regulator
VSERRANKKERFFDALPEKFTYKEFVELAGNLSIQHRTAERYIRTFCEKGLIDRSQQGVYTNPNHCAHEEKQIKIA